MTLDQNGPADRTGWQAPINDPRWRACPEPAAPLTGRGVAVIAGVMLGAVVTLLAIGTEVIRLLERWVWSP